MVGRRQDSPHAAGRGTCRSSLRTQADDRPDRRRGCGSAPAGHFRQHAGIGDRDAGWQARQFGVKICCSPGGEEQTPFFTTRTRRCSRSTRPAPVAVKARKRWRPGRWPEGGRTLEAPRVRRQVGRGGLRQRPAGGDAPHLSQPRRRPGSRSIQPRWEGRGAFLASVADESGQSVLTTRANRGSAAEENQPCDR